MCLPNFLTWPVYQHVRSCPTAGPPLPPNETYMVGEGTCGVVAACGAVQAGVRKARRLLEAGALEEVRVVVGRHGEVRRVSQMTFMIGRCLPRRQVRGRVAAGVGLAVVEKSGSHHQSVLINPAPLRYSLSRAPRAHGGDVKATCRRAARPTSNLTRRRQQTHSTNGSPTCMHHLGIVPLLLRGPPAACCTIA